MKRSGIGRLVRIVAVAAAIVLVGYGLFLAAFPLLMRWQLQPRVSLSEEQIKEIEARRDYFRIVGEVEFEGQRIAYDEIIQIRTEAGFTSNMGQVRGDFRTLQSRLRIVRSLDKGGALVMEVPDAGGLWSDLEGRSAIAHRPPPTILPEFYWIDDLENPSVIEGYISEGYYEQPTARLKIVRDIRLEFVPPSPEAEAKAIAQAQSEPKLGPALSMDQLPRWNAVIIFALPKRELSTIATPGDIATLQQSGQPVALSREMSEPLFNVARRQYHWSDATSEAFGVPQPKRYAGPENLEGMLYGKWTGHYADGTIPAVCNDDGKTCHALLTERGYFVFRRNWIVRDGMTLRIGATSVNLHSGQAVWLPDGDTIYLVRTRSM